MWVALSASFALACALASAGRLARAVSPTPLDPVVLRRILVRRGASALLGLRDVTKGERTLGWEHALFAAAAETQTVLREALINEQLTELGWLADRWRRVPRVCASLSTSAGFLCACITLLETLSSDASGQLGSAALLSALNALALGMAATAFCVAVQVRARRVFQERLVAVDRLVDQLRSIAKNVEAPSCSSGAAT